MNGRQITAPLQRRTGKRCGRQSLLGRTLLELMISITIGLVLLGVIIGVYTATTRINRQSSAVTRMSEDSALAMNFIGNNLRMAGFSPPRVSVSPGSTVLRNGSQVSFPDRNFIGAAIRGCDNGFASTTVAFTALSCASGAGPAAFALRFEGDTDSTPSITVAGISYPSDCLNQAVTGTTPSAYDAAPYTLVESRFSVATDAGSGTPEFFCAGNGNAFAGLPVIQYVDDLVIRYGVAADAQSAQVVRYATAAQVDALGGSVDERWSRVVSVQICMVFRSALPDQNAAGSFIDCNGNSTVSANGFLRRAYSTVFALRNRTGP